MFTAELALFIGGMALNIFVRSSNSFR